MFMYVITYMLERIFFLTSHLEIDSVLNITHGATLWLYVPAVCKCNSDPQPYKMRFILPAFPVGQTRNFKT